MTPSHYHRHCMLASALCITLIEPYDTRYTILECIFFTIKIDEIMNGFDWVGRKKIVANHASYHLTFDISLFQIVKLNTHCRMLISQDHHASVKLIFSLELGYHLFIILLWRQGHYFAVSSGCEATVGFKECDWFVHYSHSWNLVRLVSNFVMWLKQSIWTKVSLMTFLN